MMDEIEDLSLDDASLDLTRKTTTSRLSKAFIKKLLVGLVVTIITTLTGITALKSQKENVIDEEGKTVFVDNINTPSMFKVDDGDYLPKKKRSFYIDEKTTGNNVSSGIYIYSLRVGEFVHNRKMLYIK